MYGIYDYLNGNGGNDILIAAPIQGEQYATLVGGAGVDTFGVGCNIDSTVNVEFADFWVGFEDIRIYYEGYQPGSFTCYSTDKGLLFKDNAGRFTALLDGVYDYNLIADKYIQLYPYGYHGEAIPHSAWQYTTIGSIIKYGGYLSPLQDSTIIIDNTTGVVGKFLAGNAQANQIFAGSGGDTLWGAANNDILVGGLGADNFLYGANEGADFITNADAYDTVNLYNMRLSDLVGVNAVNGTITLAQDMNNAVTIQYNGTLSPAIALGDGSRYRYNGSIGTWQTA